MVRVYNEAMLAFDTTSFSIVLSVLLLLIRAIVAVTFFASSTNKLRDIKTSAKRNGMPVPVMRVVALAEFAGALGMITGVLGRFAALGLMLLMLITISIHVFKWKTAYWAEKGGWEYDLMLFALSGVVALLGSGILAIPFLNSSILIL